MRPPAQVSYDEVASELPLLVATSPVWARLAADNLPAFLADHAVCEQQVAQYALALAGWYPDDFELVEAAANLAAEEIQHFRRVVAILNRRSLATGGRRTNRWVQALRARIEPRQGPWTKVDRLLFGAIVEARSCERFTRLLEVVQESDPEVARLLADLGPAEKRHWLLFYRLAGREVEASALAERFQGWLELDRDLAAHAGVAPTVHG